MAVLRTNDFATRLRLLSGLVLFAFLLTHLLNHALALVSMDAMIVVQDWRQIVTRSLPGTALLVAALLLHVALGLSRLATRATLNLPRWQQLQIFTGLLVPLLLLPHVIETRVAHGLFGVDDGYLYVLARYWPNGALTQLALVLVAWTHAAIGLHNWLRHKSGYGAVRPLMTALAIAVPLLALAGFMVSGRAVSGMMAEASTAASVKSAVAWPSPNALATLQNAELGALLAFAALLGLVAITAAIRHVLRLGAVKFPVSYLGGPTLRVARGPTLLEFSQMHAIPHSAACGGRGRCGTCRVRVDDGLSSLPPPRGRERRMLKSLGAPSDVRLACRIRPTEAIAVSRLVNPARLATASAGGAAETSGVEDSADAAGVEKALAILAVDIVDFRGLNQRRLACDKLHLINKFVAMVDAEARARGGFVERAVADGVIAVFGHRDGLDLGCRQALETAAAIDRALDGLNDNLAAEIGRDIEIGMAAHHGRLLMGRIGTSAGGLSVIGEAVAIAGRLETLNRDVKSQLLLPREFADRAGLDVAHAIAARVEVRGITGPLDIVAFPHARDISWLDHDDRPTLALGKPLGKASMSIIVILAALMLSAPIERAVAAERPDVADDLLRRADVLARQHRAAALLRDAGLAVKAGAISKTIKDPLPGGGEAAPTSEPVVSRADDSQEAIEPPAGTQEAQPASPPERASAPLSASVDIEIPLDGFDPATGFDDKTKSLLAIIGRALADPSAAASRFAIVGHAETDPAGDGRAPVDGNGTAEARSRTYAEAVKAFLVATAGLTPDRLVVSPSGAKSPKWPDRPADVANRRVVILSLSGSPPTRAAGIPAAAGSSDAEGRTSEGGVDTMPTPPKR